MMTDLYIETPTQADYDDLTRLAESAGFEWASGNKMSEEPNNYLDEREETVIHLNARLHEIWYGNQRYYRDKIIEGIPNLADIKAIWRVQPDDHKAFFKGKSYKHPLPSDESVIMLEMTDGLTGGLLVIHKALAVEYKPKESEDIMNEKVKLPKFVCDWLDQNKEWLCGHPMTDVSMLRRKRDTVGAVKSWLVTNTNTQWKLIDALRYGYEAEAEPRWGIKAGNCYMENITEWSFESIVNTSATLAEFDYFTDKAKADDLVKTLGFGDVVDLDKEGKADE